MNQIWNMPKKPYKNSTIDQQRSKRNIEHDEDITFLLNGVGNYKNVPHQVASEIKVKDFQEIAS